MEKTLRPMNARVEKAIETIHSLVPDIDSQCDAARLKFMAWAILVCGLIIEITVRLSPK
jgi:hypothetical protein